MNIANLRYIEDTNWDSIWENWESNEGNNPNWIEVARSKGYDTWHEWRSQWVAQFHAQNRDWKKYKVENPISTVPDFLIGPTQGWQNNFISDERNKHSFDYLVKSVNFVTHKKINEIIANFPNTTELIGIELPTKKIVLIEGHHRAAALAVMKNNPNTSKVLKEPNVIINLCEFNEGENIILDQMLKRGSHKI